MVVHTKYRHLYTGGNVAAVARNMYMHAAHSQRQREHTCDNNLGAGGGGHGEIPVWPKMPPQSTVDTHRRTNDYARTRGNAIEMILPIAIVGITMTQRMNNRAKTALSSLQR